MNNNFKYKAYVSYSHQDDKWASWLHRVLESYRVPRKLVGTQTTTGKIPPRVNPIFRDRDDLSSAANLVDEVQQALADSENMIVVCSPHAVASHWVNEEIRKFAKMGRKEHIFCVIVDGDPGGVGVPSTCFPSALAEVGLQEPLAADARKWADGKLLAKLKVVSGMLGLPLDQLRRRELQKRQKVWAFASVAAIAIAVVLVTAVTSRITAQQRRDSGESLVAYKLSELRTMLNVKDDPENLVRLEQWSQQELGKLIALAGAGNSALLNSAMDLRKQGNGLYNSGVLTGALEKFRQSWALLAENYRRDRDDQTAFFELGQAEFYIGQMLFDQGELEAAEQAFMSYAEITRRLILLQPEKADWVLEMAYALNNLGIIQKERDVNNPERHLQLMQSALEYNQIALVLDPGNEYYQSELGQSHAFLADAQIGVCDLEGAYQSRQKNVLLEQNILSKNVDDPGKIERLAFALSGFAVVNEQMGRIEAAIENLEKTLQLIGPLVTKNPEDRKNVVYALLRKNRLAMLMATNGQSEIALRNMQALDEEWQTFFQDTVSDASFANEEYSLYLLGRTKLAQDGGDLETAEKTLIEAITLITARLHRLPGNRSAENQLVEAAFQYWLLRKELPLEPIPSLLPDYELNRGRARNCRDASLAVKKAIMFSNTDRARKMATYLIDKGYRESSFMGMCQAYALCEMQ